MGPLISIVGAAKAHLIKILKKSPFMDDTNIWENLSKQDMKTNIDELDDWLYESSK